MSNLPLLTVTPLDLLSLNTIKLEESILELTKMANGIAPSSSGLIIRLNYPLLLPPLFLPPLMLPPLLLLLPMLIPMPILQLLLIKMLLMMLMLLLLLPRKLILMDLLMKILPLLLQPTMFFLLLRLLLLPPHLLFPELLILKSIDFMKLLMILMWLNHQRLKDQTQVLLLQQALFKHSQLLTKSHSKLRVSPISTSNLPRNIISQVPGVVSRNSQVMEWKLREVTQILCMRTMLVAKEFGNPLMPL